MTGRSSIKETPGKDIKNKMSKLSPALKAAINAPFARPNTVPAPPNIRSVYQRISQEATSKKVGLLPWLTISVTTTPILSSN
jgi:hypothetical protein